MKSEARNIEPATIIPDYRLMNMVHRVSDGSDVHRAAQELNIYALAIQGMNESSSEKDREALDRIRQRAETNLRAFVVRKRLAEAADNLRLAQ
jgi:hypothetical protein